LCRGFGIKVGCPYRKTKIDFKSDIEEELVREPRGYQPARAQAEKNTHTMNAAQIEALIQAALTNQELRLRAEFAGQISAVNSFRVCV